MKKVNKSNLIFCIPEVNNIPEEKKIFPIPKEEFEQIKTGNKEKLQFSFRFFDRQHEAFNLGEVKKVCDNWFLCLLDALKEVSNLNRNQSSLYSIHSFKPGISLDALSIIAAIAFSFNCPYSSLFPPPQLFIQW